MKNITLKVDDATYHRARVRAAEAGTSVSAMVRDFLNSQSNESAEEKRSEAMRALFELAEAQADYNGKPVQPMSRDEIYNERLR